MKNKGISLISLIITIIVIIILASIAVFNGFDTIEKSQFAKFTTETTSIAEAIELEFYSRQADYARKGINKSDETVYAMIALGLGPDDTLPANSFFPVPPEYADLLEGTRCYKIVTEEGEKLDSKYIVDKYVTDKGEVFFTPGYLAKEDGSENLYINATKYISSNGGGAVNPQPGFSRDMQVGDYVRYTANGNSITITTDRSGHISNETFSPVNADWRIWQINPNGSIVIVPTQPVNSVTLSGTKGCINAPAILNEVCKIYTSTSLGVTANNVRSMAVEDIEAVSPGIRASKTSYRGGRGNYAVGQKFTYTENKDCFFFNEDGLTFSPTTRPAPMTITQTYYEKLGDIEWKNLNNSEFPGQTYGHLLGNTYGWLATVLANLYYPDDYWYRIMIVQAPYFTGEQIGYSNWFNSDPRSWGVRPMVTISNVSLDANPGDGTQSSPWKLTK